MLKHRVMAVRRLETAYFDIFRSQSSIKVIVFAAPTMKL